MKTFNAYLEANPNFWDSFPSLPSSVIPILEDCFYYRQLCDDNKFEVFFRAKLNLKLDEFLTLYQKEMEFRGMDPFTLQNVEKTIDTLKNKSVADVLKSLRQFNSNITETRNTQTANSSTVTNNLTEKQTKSGEDKNVSALSGNDTTSTEGSSNETTNRDEGITQSNSDYPQSSPGLTDYLTTKSITDGQVSATDNTTTANNSTTTYGKTQTDTTTYGSAVTTTDTGTVTDAGTINNTGTVTTANASESNFNKTDNRDEDETIKIVWNELKTGNFVDLYTKYYKILTSLHAIDWLVKELDPCFLQVFDFEWDEVESGGSGGGGGGGASEEEIAEINQKISQINSQLLVTDSRVTLLRVDLNSLDADVDTNTSNINVNTSNINTLTGALTDTNNNLNGLTDLVNTNTDNITALTGVVESNTNRIESLEAGGGGGGGGSATKLDGGRLFDSGMILGEHVYNGVNYKLLLTTNRSIAGIELFKNEDNSIYAIAITQETGTVYGVRSEVSLVGDDGNLIAKPEEFQISDFFKNAPEPGAENQYRLKVCDGKYGLPTWQSGGTDLSTTIGLRFIYFVLFDVNGQVGTYNLSNGTARTTISTAEDGTYIYFWATLNSSSSYSYAYPVIIGSTSDWG